MPAIIPIPREEKGLPIDAIQVDEEEEEMAPEPGDDVVEEEQSAVRPAEENGHQMTFAYEVK